MTSFIAPTPSHINGRNVSLNTRAEVGFFSGARGVSLNSEDIDESFDDLKDTIASHKLSATDAVTGRFYRLKNTKREVCWQLSSSDGNRIYLLYVHINAGVNLPFSRIKLTELEPATRYRLQLRHESYSGDALMNIGIDLPYSSAIQAPQEHVNEVLAKGDFVSRLFLFERI